MKANELRIGNYLNGNQGHVVVSEIRLNNSVKIQYNTSSFYVGVCLKAIPLTKEWLLKLGFIQQGVIINNNGLTEQCGINYFIKNNIVYSLSDNQVELDNPNVFLCNLQYVHQLQNLYFALTGEELTYNC
jgi:hypothetical protein